MKINITYKSVLQPIKDIEERNKAFHELTNEGKRLEIAWDMLQLILQEKLRAAKGTYWQASLKRKALQIRDSKELQKLILNTKTCKVCQRGGIMYSTIRLGNKISIYQNDELIEGTRNNIEGFTMNKMFDMEDIYEGWHRNSDLHPFKKRSKERLANICCNILVNGDFKIKDYTQYITP